MRQPALAMDLAEIRLVPAGGQAEQGGLAGPVRPNQPDPVAQGDRGIDRIEDYEGADLAGDPGQPQDAHPCRVPATIEARAAARRVAAARFVRSVRVRRVACSASFDVSPRTPSPPISTQRRPARRRPPVMPRRIARPAFRSAAPRRWHHEQRCVERAPMTIRLDGPPAARARLAGPLVDLQPFLHRAVPIRCGVVVDRAAAPVDGLGQDRADGIEQPAFVRRPERRNRSQRVEPGGPERLVGIDVADPDDEGLVQQKRLQSALPAAQPSPERQRG